MEEINILTFQIPDSLYIDIEKIRKLLYDDPDFIKEFTEAATESFEEFIDRYETHLLNREEKEFRKAGHKIKPVALMIGVDEVVNEYEQAKRLLLNGEEDEKLRDSVNRTKKITDQVIQELHNFNG